MPKMAVLTTLLLMVILVIVLSLPKWLLILLGAACLYGVFKITIVIMDIKNRKEKK